MAGGLSLKFVNGELSEIDGVSQTKWDLSYLEKKLLNTGSGLMMFKGTLYQLVEDGDISFIEYSENKRLESDVFVRVLNYKQVSD